MEGIKLASPSIIRFKVQLVYISVTMQLDKRKYPLTVLRDTKTLISELKGLAAKYADLVDEVKEPA